MKVQCDSCGTCCRNGGPPLHSQDKKLVTEKILSFNDLVTVRRGELVIPPMATNPVTAETEWLKIQGHGVSWCCRFLDMTSNMCTIYQDRPVSCRALKCWDTEGILKLTGQDLINRLDLIAQNDPLLPLVLLHEKKVPVPDLVEIQQNLPAKNTREKMLEELSSLVQEDLNFRTSSAHEFNISVSSELFYFGRPLFQILYPLGIETLETREGVQLRYHPR